jgi:hypothetical protein
MENNPLEAPDFAELLNQIRLHMPWEPTLPAHFYNTKAAGQLNYPPVNNSGSTQTGTITGPTAVAPAITTSSLDTSKPAPPFKGRGTIVRKSQPINPVFQKFVDMDLRVQDVIVRAGPAHRVPTNNDGTEMCLAYHLKGLCNSNCARHQDHKDHQPAEDKKKLHYKPE